VHLAIDDHSRLAYSEILPDEKRRSCLRFLFNALRFFRNLGVRVERVMTDNGSSFRSHRYAKALRRLKIKHLRTRPYTPRTNGKAERFVQTSLREWAYARAYSTSEERAAELCPSGCTATTGIALMAVSAPSRQLAGSAYPGTTC
jgi:transposase InsO family protein